MMEDGLNTLKYSVEKIEKLPSHTHVYVNVTGPRDLDEMETFIRNSVDPSLGAQSHSSHSSVSTVPSARTVSNVPDSTMTDFQPHYGAIRVYSALLCCHHGNSPKKRLKQHYY